VALVFLGVGALRMPDHGSRSIIIGGTCVRLHVYTGAMAILCGLVRQVWLRGGVASVC